MCINIEYRHQICMAKTVVLLLAHIQDKSPFFTWFNSCLVAVGGKETLLAYIMDYDVSVGGYGC